ncbi:uncharacterized protein DUF4440 [Halopolyspora algeriensis]|uniref:Uncharacterized protein DUF4440 n=1 Tax=Halopolyspora algeriensis TaxID=1500506 RepID=A0A368VYB3_9ACTN|nr:nuclear transport factor 2 family protein [Halopolyspora algeriensis]RCW45227.1 uncharacterized protein DUF4440 [Halopolyspora algeriensis]TQM53054.1 uncharacterized protein DUF4440 [Halopolyspora algeriensis]
MDSIEDLSALEERGWRALSTSGEAATDFYRHVLDREPVMLFPGGMVLTDRDAILESMGGQPWTTFRFDGLRVSRPTDDTGLVTYGAVAHREGSPEYSALVSSMYVRRHDGWKLAFHQHTPR